MTARAGGQLSTGLANQLLCIVSTVVLCVRQSEYCCMEQNYIWLDVVHVPVQYVSGEAEFIESKQ